MFELFNHTEISFECNYLYKDDKRLNNCGDRGSEKPVMPISKQFYDRVQQKS